MQYSQQHPQPTAVGRGPTATKQQQQQLVCTCPPEVHQAMYEAQQCIRSGRPLPKELLQVLSMPQQHQQPQQQSQQMPEATAVQYIDRLCHSEAQLNDLSKWMQQHHQHHHLQQQQPQQQQPQQQQPQQQHQQQQQGHRAVHVPSNSSLDSAISAQSVPSDNSATGQTTSLRASRDHLDLLRRTRWDMAQLRSDFEALRQSYQQSLACVNRMFAERLACLQRVQEASAVTDALTVHPQHQLQQQPQLQHQQSSTNHHQQQQQSQQPMLLAKRRSQLRATLQTYRQETQATEKQLAELERAVASVGQHHLSDRTRQTLSETLRGVTKSLVGAKTVFEAEVNRGVRELIRDGFDDATTAEYFISQEPSRLEQSFQRCHKLTDAIKSLAQSAGSERDDNQSPPVRQQQASSAAGHHHQTEVMYHAQPEYRPASACAIQPGPLLSAPVPAKQPSPPRLLPKPGGHVNPTYDEYMPPPPPPPQPAQSHHHPQQHPPPTRPSRTGRPQVAFSDTVKVDDGSEVVRLNWPDEPDSEPVEPPLPQPSQPQAPLQEQQHRRRDFQNPQQPHQQQQQQPAPRTPPPPPPRKSSSAAASAAAGGPQKPTSDYENLDAEKVRTRQYHVFDAVPPQPPPHHYNQHVNKASASPANGYHHHQQVGASDIWLRQSTSAGPASHWRSRSELSPASKPH